MITVSLPDLIQKNIHLKNISSFVSEHENGYQFTTPQDKPRMRCGIIFVEGEISFIYAGKQTRYTTGDVLFFPVSSHYSYRYEQEGTKIYSVNFNIYGEDGVEIVPFTKPTFLSHTQDDIIKEHFLRCVHLFKTSTNRILLKSEVYAILSDISILFASEHAPTGIQGAIDTIRNNIHDELRISDLALACGMSESTFRREFHRYAGVSPKQYILDRKINKAKQMLRSGYYPIKEICMILGFYDDAYFSKIFKKATGLTPIQYIQEKGKL